MLCTVMTSKIHRATETQADLHHGGSVTVDVINGARLETDTIAGERGSGAINIKGAAARLVAPEDIVILVGHGQLETEEARAFTPSVVVVDAHHAITGTGHGPVDTFGAEALTRGDHPAAR